MITEESEAREDEYEEEGGIRVWRSDVDGKGLRLLLRRLAPPLLVSLVEHLVILRIRIREDKMVVLKNKDSLENNSFPNKIRTYSEAVFTRIVGASRPGGDPPGAGASGTATRHLLKTGSEKEVSRRREIQE